MSLLSQDALAALDRMDQIAYVWQAIGDLMNPDGDLQERQRDNLACAIGFLQHEYDQARQAFTHAIHQEMQS